jgi:hypothetical protein
MIWDLETVKATLTLLRLGAALVIEWTTRMLALLWLVFAVFTFVLGPLERAPWAEFTWTEVITAAIATVGPPAAIWGAGWFVSGILIRIGEDPRTDEERLVLEVTTPVRLREEMLRQETGRQGPYNDGSTLNPTATQRGGTSKPKP